MNSGQLRKCHGKECQTKNETPTHPFEREGSIVHARRRRLH